MKPTSVFLITPPSYLKRRVLRLTRRMKLEDFLMEKYTEHQRRLDLEEEVAELQEVLEKEEGLRQILQWALHGPITCCSCLSSLLPLQVQVLLADIAMVEEEIICLEREAEDLKLCLYQEKRRKEELNLQRQSWQQQERRFLCSRKKIREAERSPQLPNTEIRDEEAESSRRCNKRNQIQSLQDDVISAYTPNKLSEELVKILISIFNKLSQTSIRVNCEPATFPKLNVPCMSSRSFVSKSSSKSRMSVYSSKNTTQTLEPNGVLLEDDGTARGIGSHKRFIQFTRSSLDMSRISLCLPAIRRLRVYMHKLCIVEPSFMTYKQKLAFWINIYNACIMHAFLQYGLPPSLDKMLALLNKAAVNVGGIVLNALAIEHFILRHSADTKNVFIDEKEALQQHAYGLCYPEPNVTFSLCRGSWSSPALRVYTAEGVVNELERAKVEYLEASVSITSKKIFMPKLLHWHMRDFADDVESLLEWIYSQLSGSGSLKRSIMDCLSRDTKIPLSKMYIVGDGNNVYDFTYVENVAYAHVCAEKTLASEGAGAEKAAGQAYFITNMEPMKFWEFMSLILEGLGYERPRTKIPVAVIMPIAHVIEWTYKLLSRYGMRVPQLTPSRIRLLSCNRTFNCSKAKNQISHEPIVSLEDGLKRTIESYPHLRAVQKVRTSKAFIYLGSGNIAHTLLWKDMKQKLTVLLLLATIYYYFFASGYTIITAMAKLLSLVALFLFIPSMLPEKIFGYKIENIPPSYFHFSEEKAHHVACAVSSSWNSSFGILRSLCKGNDWLLFFKVAMWLLILSFLGAMSAETLFKIGVPIAFIAFYAYEKWEDEIDGVFNESFAYLLKLKSDVTKRKQRR